jgi:hypothetical protein
VTSFILKSPVYKEMQVIIQKMNMKKTVKMARTIDQLRNKYNLKNDIGINEVKIGR